MVVVPTFAGLAADAAAVVATAVDVGPEISYRLQRKLVLCDHKWSMRL